MNSSHKYKHSVAFCVTTPPPPPPKLYEIHDALKT